MANTINATGGTITNVEIGGKTYKVHVFTSSGTFNVTQAQANAEVEYLVIAGGGAGGRYAGGGAGGYRSSVVSELSGRNTTAESKVSITAQSYTITVGGGGSPYSNNGSNSSALGITSLGGGNGAVIRSTPGGTGGSGGGATAGWVSGDYRSLGQGTAGQGFEGGNSGTYYGTDGGAGGGGAGAPGGLRPSQYVPGNGGNGIESNITGTPTYRAGGGAGATKASQGGQGVGTSGLGQSGVNSGGGGIGTDDAIPATSGNSGIVIIRYEHTEPFTFSNISINKLYFGNTEIVSAFLGTQQFYSSGPAPFELGTVTSDNLSGNLGHITYSSTSGLYLTSDGSKLFASTSGAYVSIVREYNLSTPYNISTISLVNTFDPTEIDNHTSGATFSNDGNFLFIASSRDGGKLFQYSLSTPFSLSSVSFVRQRDVSGDATPPCYSMQFNNDGTKMYVLFTGYTSYPNTLHRLIEYNLSTAYNIGTASISTSYDVPYTGFGMTTVFHFNNDGSKLFLKQAGVIQQYNLSTPFSVSTISQDSNNFSPGNGSFAFSSDGTKLYLGDTQQNTLVSQYTNTF